LGPFVKGNVVNSAPDCLFKKKLLDVYFIVSIVVHSLLHFIHHYVFKSLHIFTFLLHKSGIYIAEVLHSDFVTVIGIMAYLQHSA